MLTRTAQNTKAAPEAHLVPRQEPGRSGLATTSSDTTSTVTAGMAVVRRAVIAGLSTLFAGCSATGGERPPLKLANDVDLERYFGRWYIIANIPYFAERGNMGTFVEYAHRPDGQIADVYYAHEHGFASPLTRREGRAYVVPGSNNALWRVTFLWPIYVSYPIIHVEADYRTALVGYPDRSLGWVFSRDRHMDDAIYRDLLKRFAAQGYDTSQFKRVPQRL
jgi:apolipoprotein D and lipocalin family protein